MEFIGDARRRLIQYARSCETWADVSWRYVV